MLWKISILYLSQIIKVMLPLLFVPLTISVLGVEKYGLISFMTMFIGFLGIMDLGISGALIRIISTNRNDFASFNKVLSVFFKVIFFSLSLSIVLSAAFIFFADGIYSSWLRTTVSRDDAILSIKFIGFIVACVYFKSYISSFILGMEKQECVAIWGVVYSFAFYCGSYCFIKYVSASLILFFEVLAMINLVDILALALLLFFIIYRHKKNVIILSDTNPSDTVTLTSMIKLSFHLSGLSIIWTIATQIDKIALSMYSYLDDYTHYQIATQLAATVTMLTIPLSQYLMPRLSSLYKREQHRDLIKELSISFFWFAFLIIPVAPYFFIFGDKLISIWIMSDYLGEQINKNACWLISSAIINALMNFLFITLFSMERLKMHFYVYSIYSILTIPMSIIVAKYYGAEGSSIFTFLHSFCFMFFWGGVGMNLVFKEMLIPLLMLALYSLLSSVFIFKSIETYFVASYGLFSVLLPPVINIIVSIFPLYFMRDKIIKCMAKITIRNFS